MARTMGYGGTYGNGSVFEIACGSTAITPLAPFSEFDSRTALVLDSSGNLYGTTEGGGVSSDGNIFEVVHGSSTITTLVSFNGASGFYPQAPLLLDSSGNLYGVASIGGVGNAGSVFELTPTPPQLSFTAPPASTVAGATLGGIAAVQVAVQYSWGNAVTSDSSTVTFTLSGGTFSSGSNTATATAVNGVANFNNLSIDAAGTYTLTATDGTDAPITSAPFSVTPAPNSVTGIVFNDTNDNGSLDSGEGGQPGVNVTLTPTGVTTGSPIIVATAGDGYYIFANVNPGTYSVSESPPGR